ncbi:polyprenyl synthetase family protein [Streptomyces alkaliphilus]|uniref:Polyprenyl synthetase family protein n=1 Tax=Streptomyces alkaliphilus TaxID=1472722 RepID=A0A7W3Y0I9_9ACTN|nr:polyprenyl synthetase family protein [Streptomyces alkaliphilus]MBB0243341.1 polyprenyl synthetase family protein [Streptomyces alkaliphilus]
MTTAHRFPDAGTEPAPLPGGPPAPREGVPSTARETLEAARHLLEPALRDRVNTLPAPLAGIASYHFGWTDAAGRPDAGPTGKALRPALVTGCAEAVGGSAPDAVAPAVAVELVHNFSLLHDDILDGDTTRRHRATAWAVFGSPAALLTGDALLALASRVLAEDDSPHVATGIRWLARSTELLIEGERADISFEERERVTLAECLAMAERKTAELLACSCALGALWGGAEPERIAALRAFGRHLGTAFQLTDDLLGIWGDPAVTGKPARADLACRKKSLPVVAAMESETPAGRRLARRYGPTTDGAAEETPGELALLARLVEEAGGREWARRRASEELDRALVALEAAEPEPDAGRRLSALARLACRRDR